MYNQIFDMFALTETQRPVGVFSGKLSLGKILNYFCNI